MEYHYRMLRQMVSNKVLTVSYGHQRSEVCQSSN